MSAAAHLQACSLCEQMTLLSEKGKSHTEEFKFKVWCQHNENSHNRAPSSPLPTKPSLKLPVKIMQLGFVTFK